MADQSGTRTDRSTKSTTDHDTIRRWAEERDGTPSHVKGTGGDGDPGILRIDFPGYSGDDSLEAISWEEWFEKFDESDLVFLYRDDNFNKLVSRESAEES